MDVDKFLHVIEGFPQLYDVRLHSYMDRDLKENSWKSVAEEMNINGECFNQGFP